MILNNIIINGSLIFDVNESKLIPLNQEGENIILNTPTARCLQLLVERQGMVVSREDFIEQVWGTKGIVVSQNTFYQNISLLRKSLKKAGLSKDLIVTVRRKGFTLSREAVITLPDNQNAMSEGAVDNPALSLGVSTLRPVDSEPSFLQKVNPGGNKNLLRTIPGWVIILVTSLLLAEVFIFFWFISRP